MQTTSGAHVWLVLMKAYRSMLRHAELSHKAHELGFSDFVVLETLLHKGPRKVNEIGREIELTSGAITAAVDRVEQRGFVARSFDDTDRRARIVKLTPAGETLIREVFASHAQALEQAAGGLNPEERGTLVALLRKLGLFADRQLSGQNEEGDT